MFSEIFCATLTSFKNGTVTYSSTSAIGVPFGGTASFSCTSPLTLKGSATSTCGGTANPGTWSSLPFCSKSLFESQQFFYVNKSCRIECCGYKTHQIIQNKMLSQSLELKLSLLRRTTISGQHPLFYRWGKVGEPLLPLYFNGRRG